MKAVITRSMVVANDAGETEQFRPSTEDKPFVEVSEGVFGRLKRAGAAGLYVEEVAQAGEAEADDISKLSKADLVKYAEVHAIAIDADATKAVIIEAIKAATTPAE
jgi:hypothetical protein